MSLLDSIVVANLINTFSLTTISGVITATSLKSTPYFLHSTFSIVATLLFAVVATTLADNFEWSPRHVETKLGVVQGFVEYPKNVFSGGVEVFLNLPYASPPVGNLRFMPPVSASPWSGGGVRRSEHFGPVCPQVLPDIRNETLALLRMPWGKLEHVKRLLPHLKNQSEDCLYLNLYVPLAVAEGREKEKLPILVFVHGDDYSFGSGNPYNPSMLVSYGNIITVTFNFRLGILGFLNANSDSHHFRLPYNFALLDIIAALQWIQENIGLFGGDKNKVTLMGHGKGAVMVNFLMISPAVPTGLLFHRVILSSDSAFSPSSSDLSRGLQLSKRFAKRAKCPSDEPSSAILKCLKELPLRQFLESELWSSFGPSEDGIVVKREMLSDEDVIVNRASQYPLLFGSVKAEALPSLSDQDASYGLEDERRKEILRQFIHKNYRFHRNEILAGAVHEYTNWERPGQHPQNVRDETLNALADAQVVAPMTKMGDLHSQSARSQAYSYVFEYQSKSSAYRQRLGCVHGEDLLYVFGAPLFFYDFSSSSESETIKGDISRNYASSQLLLSSLKTVSGGLGFFMAGNFTTAEVQLSITVMRLWTNFVRVGNPNGGGDTERSNNRLQKDQSKSSLLKDSKSESSETTFIPINDEKSSNQWSHKSKQLPQLSETTLVEEWPQYDSLDKKYLVLDLRPKIQSHYRAHKLSFWLHLVPDYQKNGEEVAFSLHHHGVMFTNSSKPRKTSSKSRNATPSFNSSKKTKSPKSSSRELFAGGAIIVPDSKKQQQDSGEHYGSPPLELDVQESFGFLQSYSTALSVTIAIGVSLLILNLFLLATFYYERNKRFPPSSKSVRFVPSSVSEEQGESRRNTRNKNQTCRNQRRMNEEHHHYSNFTDDSLRRYDDVCPSTSAYRKRRKDKNAYFLEKEEGGPGVTTSSPIIFDRRAFTKVNHSCGFSYCEIGRLRYEEDLSDIHVDNFEDGRPKACNNLSRPCELSFFREIGKAETTLFGHNPFVVEHSNRRTSSKSHHHSPWYYDDSNSHILNNSFEDGENSSS